MRILIAVCSMQYKFTAQRVTQVSFFEVITSKRSRGRQWVFIMLCLARVVSQFPSQYFGKLPGFNLRKLTRFREFFPVCRPFFEASAGTWSKITSRRLRSLIGQLSFPLVPNIMVLSKMNDHGHRTKQSYESYTFQPLMSFWCERVKCTYSNFTWWPRKRP